MRLVLIVLASLVLYYFLVVFVYMDWGLAGILTDAWKSSDRIQFLFGGALSVWFGVLAFLWR